MSTHSLVQSEKDCFTAISCDALMLSEHQPTRHDGKIYPRALSSIRAGESDQGEVRGRSDP